MRSAKRQEMRRLSLVTSETTRQRMEALQDKCDADSLAEVVRRSVSLYELLWDASQQGNRIVIESDDGSREVLLV